MSSTRYRQLRLDDQGTPLSDVDFVVVDLETTGTDPRNDAITEIGALRVRAGVVIGEFQTFVNPQRPIPSYVQSLTGITDRTVRDAPPIAVVLPTFLDFARGATFVAHNARFDIGFLKAQAAKLGEPWPRAEVIDTLALARSLYGRDEVRNHRLGTLAQFVGSPVTPDHRALTDARATVDLLYAIVERLGTKALTLEDLRAAHRKVKPVQMRKRHLADTVPAAPGVYRFLDIHGDVLYVGTSRNMRSRVHQYFTAAEKRRAVLDVLPRLETISTLECVSRLEAAVLELREIALHRPPANRRSLSPGRALWLTVDPPRRAKPPQVRATRRAANTSDGNTVFIGPLSSRQDVDPLRSLMEHAARTNDIWRAESGAGKDREATDPHTLYKRLEILMTEDPSPVLAYAGDHMRARAHAGMYEVAERTKSDTMKYLHAFHRANTLRGISQCPRIIAARPGDETAVGPRGWEIIVIEYGRLVGAGLALPGEDPLQAVHRIQARVSPNYGIRENHLPEAHTSSVCATSTSHAAFQRDPKNPSIQKAAMSGGLLSHGWARIPDPSLTGQNHHEETTLIVNWLSRDDVRIVDVEGQWAAPLYQGADAETLLAAYASTSSHLVKATHG